MSIFNMTNHEVEGNLTILRVFEEYFEGGRRDFPKEIYDKIENAIWEIESYGEKTDEQVELLERARCDFDECVVGENEIVWDLYT